MALEKCKECGAQISTKAKICPSCGAPQIRTSAGTKLIAWFIVFSVVVSGFMSCISSNQLEQAAEAESTRLASLTPAEREAEAKLKADAAKKEQEQETAKSAIYACKELIKRQMKDPSSVEFLFSTNETPVSKNKKGNYDVLAKVRAKNSFNAYVISDFKCTVALSDKNWTLLNLKKLR